MRLLPTRGAGFERRWWRFGQLCDRFVGRGDNTPPPPRLPLSISAIPCGPFFRSDVLIAALVRSFFRSTERVFNVLLADRRGVASARAFDERLQIRPSGFVEWDGWLLRLLVHAAPPRLRRTGGVAAFDTGRNTLMMPKRALSAL